MNTYILKVLLGASLAICCTAPTYADTVLLDLPQGTYQNLDTRQLFRVDDQGHIFQQDMPTQSPKKAHHFWHMLGKTANAVNYGFYPGWTQDESYQGPIGGYPAQVPPVQNMITPVFPAGFGQFR